MVERPLIAEVLIAMGSAVIAGMAAAESVEGETEVEGISAGVRC